MWRNDSKLQRAVTALAAVYAVLQSILLTVFLGVVAMMLAAWLGAGGVGILGAGVLGLMLGLAVSRRMWFRKPAPAAERPPLEPWRLPGIQDEFDRLHARQRVLGFLLVAALLVLVVLRFAARQDWPAPFGVPRDRLLAGALVAVAIIIPLGLLNWRCPHCRRNLGRGLSVRQCPHCGVVLRG